MYFQKTELLVVEEGSARVILLGITTGVADTGSGSFTRATISPVNLRAQKFLLSTFNSRYLRHLWRASWSVPIHRSKKRSDSLTIWVKLKRYPSHSHVFPTQNVSV